MSKFKPNEYQVDAAAPAKAGEVRVVKESIGDRQVRDFQYESLRGNAPRDYGSLKKKYGALAVTDPDHRKPGQKDKRFALHELVRGPLSVEEEERRALEERVQARVNAIREEARAEASRQGYEEGLKNGHAEAFRRFREEGAERLARLDEVLAAAEAAKEEIFRANEKFLLELVYRIARMVLLKELATDKEYLLRLTRELIERMGVRENITIRIHPDDKESLTMLKEGLDQAFGGLKNLNIEVSAQLSRGGCTVETAWNAIDASIETQLSGVYAALIGKPAASAGEVP
ncbi:MAG: FliH/SctL family protein [Oligoflexia bacterium]|nr:FliH/SctL family protein [Oligoflexia bacterium]